MNISKQHITKNQQVIKQLQDDVTKWKDKFEWLSYEINSKHDEAQALYEDMKNNRFTVGSVEAEGYLRFAITMKNFLNSINEE